MKFFALIVIGLSIENIAAMQEGDQRLASPREESSSSMQRPLLIPSECNIPAIVIIDKVINNTNARWSIETDKGSKLHILPHESKSTSILFQPESRDKLTYTFKKIPFLQADGKTITLHLSQSCSYSAPSSYQLTYQKDFALLFGIDDERTKFENLFQIHGASLDSIFLNHYAVELNEEFPDGIKFSEIMQQVCKASLLPEIFDYCFEQESLEE